MQENQCPKCNSSDKLVHVSSGVDKQGEWHTLECERCGHVWVVQ